MPYDRHHVLAQWGGTLPGGEIWSNSLRLAGDNLGTGTTPSLGSLEAWCDGPAKDAVAAYVSNSTTKIASGCKLTYLKMNVVDLNGRYVLQNTVEHVFSPVVSGGTSGSVHPNQVTLAVSTTTEFSRGHAHRGRLYLPLPRIDVDAVDGTITAADALGVALATATFIEALADEPGPDLFGGMRVCVMSKMGTGATNVVTGVEVGRVLDTQRRRRTELPENYQFAEVDQGTT